MSERTPHISLSLERLVPRVLDITAEELDTWPEDAKNLAVAVAAELFLVRSNPFINADDVKTSVEKRLADANPKAWGTYPRTIKKAYKAFWDVYEADSRFRDNLVERLRQFLPDEAVVTAPNSLIECSTDATDLRMELPLCMLLPETEAHIRHILRLANELEFAIIPRGGGSGLTGGAIPAHRRSAILSLAKFKKILDIDTEAKVLCAQTGVITLTAIKAAAAKGLLFTVDPASKAASSLGGNIAENAGGPFAFEYGTTLDNIISYRMVEATGEIIEVRRVNHPRHKIQPDETAVFEILDEDGAVRDVVTLPGNQIRGLNLGKDVSNKFLGGLPGVQKEGVDGIITVACFALYDIPKYSRTLCLEFFGRSMKNAMCVIRDVVGLRNRIREEGDAVKISALEEFNSKYVKAISYAKKSALYEGDPISVLLLQLDSDDEDAMLRAAADIVDIVDPYDNVDVFEAKDAKTAELYWEDRHKLSAISKRTSGFKINEDVVIPLSVVPEFAEFLEELNLKCIARAYRTALQNAGRLPGIPASDEFIAMELEFCDRVLRNKISARDLSDSEVEVQTHYFFTDLASRYPRLKEGLQTIHTEMTATRIEVASHMHAGDGNCHVNIPVNSNDPEMMRQAWEAAEEVFETVTRLGGAVSGEHGIGITKIAFLAQDKIDALKAYKKRVDPKDIINPGKLTTRILTVEPYTFSFNRLIRDIKKTALPDKDILISILSGVQFCNRCGKCKQVCPMFAPERGMLYHPRNKNISFGALVEAIYYSQITHGEPDKALLDKLRGITDHCTACGKCTGVCSVKIQSGQVALGLRSFLDQQDCGGHPIKHKILNYLAEDPAKRVPQAGKLMAYGQQFHGKAMTLVPKFWRNRIENPGLRGPNPSLGLRNLAERLDLDKGSIFIPQQGREAPETVLYFPGCGASVFSSIIGMAAVHLLLRAEVAVLMPHTHLCCGYPLLAAGMGEAYRQNRERNRAALAALLEEAEHLGLSPAFSLTSCGTCRESIEEHELKTLRPNLVHMDVTQFLLGRLEFPKSEDASPILYHAACHSEWSDVPKIKAADMYRAALAETTGRPVVISPNCCGESGTGAMTTPAIYNRLRDRKRETLAENLADAAETMPILVGCPSCKMGISRILAEMRDKHTVMHTLEYLAEALDGPKWKKLLSKNAKAARVRG
ncbi:oxidoreductase, FAD/iron-sulfur cluster-binding domain protein [Desulfovibrio sp. DV]|uniref:FAD-binding and (Fe-S)-binding domain-containing protein n=1 Tax=Desulfovibrio sp. DV TaxID=1844708 RepID=UPI00094BBE3F|nr:FAD-binding and (Fe-S)-binding domain-containing protein [Desulfovibrio sp. DV]OLN25773.1 oxidoreductase, FAD/iron-sulfur cluster-binding domain protein [Desulfovibrio sp. DV]